MAPGCPSELGAVAPKRSLGGEGSMPLYCSIMAARVDHCNYTVQEEEICVGAS